MNRSICSLLFAAWLLLPGSCAPAEETKQPAVWSLQDCIEAAMGNQVDVLTAKNNVIIARSRSDKAKSSYFPQLSLQNNAFRWGSQGVLTQVSTGTALTVNQNVFDGGLREANLRSARYGVAQNQAGLTRTMQTVVYNVTKAYYEVLRARHLLDTAEANVKYNEELRDQVQARADLGDAARADVLPVEAQLANARVDLVSAKDAVRRTIIQLQNTMGVSSQPGFDVQEIDSPPNPHIALLNGYIESAIKSRPDISEAQASLGAARASLRAARVSLYPRPVISGDYQRRISGGFTSSGTQVVGGIVFDLFNGNANRAAYREAKASRANAEIEQRQVYKDIQVQVEEAYLNLTTANERMAATALSLEAAKKNYEVQKDRYNQGLGTTLDLLNAEVQVVTAQSRDIQARYDCYVAIAQMDYVAGKQEEVDEK